MLTLPQEVTQLQATALLAQLEQAVPTLTAQALTVDASALQRFDSSALALLLQLRRDALERKLRFEVKGLPTRLRDLAVLYGVAELLTEAA